MLLPLGGRFQFRIEFIIRHAEEHAKSTRPRLGHLSVLRVSRDLDLVLGPGSRFLVAELELDALELLGRDRVKPLGDKARVRGRLERILGGDHLNDFLAERRPDDPAKRVVASWDFHGLTGSHVIIGLRRIWKYLKSLAVRLLVNDIQVRVLFAHNANRQRITFPVTPGGTVNVDADEKTGPILANAVGRRRRRCVSHSCTTNRQ